MTPTRLPYLHKNARSRRITAEEIASVYADEITRGLPPGVDRDEYLRNVLP